MPQPTQGESWRDFIARCMSDEEARQDFPDVDQRLAFCYSQLEERKEEKNGTD